jgi:protein-tyrosine phosphatase
MREVPDPDYGAPAGFERVLDLIEASTVGLLAHLQPLLATRGADLTELPRGQ